MIIGPDGKKYTDAIWTDKRGDIVARLHSDVDAPDTPAHRPESRMSDEWLADVRRVVRGNEGTLYSPNATVRTLLAEIDRLRRENHLLNLSRGTPSVE